MELLNTSPSHDREEYNKLTSEIGKRSVQNIGKGAVFPFKALYRGLEKQEAQKQGSNNIYRLRTETPYKTPSPSQKSPKKSSKAASDKVFNDDKKYRTQSLKINIDKKQKNKSPLDTIREKEKKKVKY